MKNIISFFGIILTSLLGFAQIQLSKTLISEREVITNLDVPWDMVYRIFWKN